MGLLDDLKEKVMTGAAPAPAPASDTSGLAQAVFGMLINRQDGLSGLISAFQSKGLGNIVSSWISTGQNLPISPEQLQDVVGPDQVKQLADSSGVSPDVAKAQLADILPRVVDRLTPDGSLPKEPLAMNALDMLKKLF